MPDQSRWIWRTLAPALLVALAACEGLAQQSWVFAPARFTHDPVTGARVAQYQRVAPVEALGDPRLVTSRYRRTRSTLRGPDGAVDSTFQVQSYANGRGGLDAEWERFNDAWRQSLLSGSFFFQNRPAPLGAAYGYPGDSFNPAFGAALPNGAFGDPRFRNPFPPGPGFLPGPFDTPPGLPPGAGQSGIGPPAAGPVP